MFTNVDCLEKGRHANSRKYASIRRKPLSPDSRMTIRRYAKRCMRCLTFSPSRETLQSTFEELGNVDGVGESVFGVSAFI